MSFVLFFFLSFKLYLDHYSGFDNDAALYGPMMPLSSDSRSAVLEIGMDVPKELQFMAPGLNVLDAKMISIEIFSLVIACA